MQFRVTGKSRTTGEPVQTVVEAADESAARRAAEGMDIFPTSVAPVFASRPIPLDLAPPPAPAPAPKTMPPVPGGRQIPVAAPAQPRAGRFGPRMISAIVAGLALIAAVAALIVVAYLGNTGIGRFSQFLPGASLVSFNDIDALRDTDFWRDLIGPMERQNQRYFPGLRIEISDIAQLFRTGEPKTQISIVQLRADWTLDELVIDRRGPRNSHAGREYLCGESPRGGALYVARIAPKLYCIALPPTDEATFKQALSLARENKSPKFPADLQRAFDAVRRKQIVMLCTSPDNAAANIPRLGAAGLDVGHAVALSALLVFADERSASEARRQFTDMRQQAQSATYPPGTRDAVLKALAGGIETTLDGRNLQITGRWDYSELRRVCGENPNLFLTAVGGLVGRQR